MIQAFILDEETGETRYRHSAATTAQIAMMPLPEGCMGHIFEGEGSIADFETYLDGAEIKVRPRTPDLALDLMVAKINKRQAVALARNTHEWSGAATPLGRMDSDPDSQRKVNGAASMAMIASSAGQPFSIDWTMQDNSTVTHDAAAMMAAGVAMGEHVSACHDRAKVLKANIDDAADAAALEAIDIEAGWP